VEWVEIRSYSSYKQINFEFKCDTQIIKQRLSMFELYNAHFIYFLR
jgi:hypothetical protein